MILETEEVEGIHQECLPDIGCDPNLLWWESPDDTDRIWMHHISSVEPLVQYIGILIFPRPSGHPSPRLHLDRFLEVILRPIIFLFIWTGRTSELEIQDILVFQLYVISEF